MFASAFDDSLHDADFRPREWFGEDHWDDYPLYAYGHLDSHHEITHPDMIDAMITELMQYMTKDHHLVFNSKVSPSEL